MPKANIITIKTIKMIQKLLIDGVKSTQSIINEMGSKRIMKSIIDGLIDAITILSLGKHTLVTKVPACAKLLVQLSNIVENNNQRDKLQTA